MFGFVGIAAGIVTIVTGGVIDRSGPLPVIGVGLVLLLVATGGIAILDPSNPWLFAGLLFLVTLANQSILSASQSRALAANPTTPAQANTLFMAGVFLGGSAGALTGVVAYELGEMRMVATAAVGLVVAGLGAWLAVVVTAGRRTPTTNHRSLSSPPAHAGQDHCQH
jgi:predicted MFS family arabinose efflux permease